VPKERDDSSGISSGDQHLQNVPGARHFECFTLFFTAVGVERRLSSGEVNYDQNPSPYFLLAILIIPLKVAVKRIKTNIMQMYLQATYCFQQKDYWKICQMQK
jgi:hypothetical protein